MNKLYLRALLAVPALLIATAMSAQINSVTLTPPVGPSVGYPSITSAYAAIPAAPTGNYLIEIQGVYNGNDASEIYPITLGDKGLLPGGFNITIRPAAGNNGETIQRTTPASGDVIMINGGDNIIFDGRPGGITTVPANYLTVNDPVSGDNNNRNFELLNGANNNTIEYLNVTAAQATAAAAGSRVIAILASGTANNNNVISNNVVTGGLRGIQVFGTVANNSGTVITNNTVMNFGAIGIFAGNFQDNTTIQNNTINFTVMPLTTAITGIQNQGTTVTTNITDNTVSIPLTTNSVTTSIGGIANLGNGTVNILRNTISNLTGNGATNVTGISNSPNTVAATVNMTGNTISFLNTNAVAASFVVGIAHGTGTLPVTLNLSGNKISNLSSTGPANLRGLSLFPFAGSTLNVNNNFISITQTNATATFLFGMLFGLTGTTNPYTSNVYFNSVRIGGTQTGGTAANIYATGIYRGDNTAGSVFNMKNNISIMDRTGGTAGIFMVGFFNSSAAGTLNINNNTYSGTAGSAGNAYAAGWVTSVYDNASLAGYQTAAGTNETASNFTGVSFVSNTDLHLTGASIADPLLNGVPAGGITTDIDGQTRSVATPRRGADEPTVVNSVVLTPPVGPSVGYTSITAAYAAIPAAPAGNYLIELQSNYNTDAVETYPIVLGDKGLLPGGFTITIRPAAGNNTAVIQRPVAASGSVISIDGGDNIILDGRPGGITTLPANYLTVNDALVGDATNRDVEILNGANNNTIEYINANAAQATAAGVGSRVIAVTTSATANNNNVITNNVITGGLRGVQVFGTVVNNSGTFIANNTVSNFGGTGILAGSFQDNTTIQNNVIKFTVMPLTTTITGIQNQGTASTTNITDNNISIPLTTNASVTSISGIVSLGNGTVNILRNNISSLNSTVATSIQGIASSPGTAAGVINISGNKIADLSSPVAVNARGIAIFEFAGTVVNVNNNFVSITQSNANATAVFGILAGVNGTTNPYTTNMYFNTVRIGGTQTGGTTGLIYGAGIYRSDNTAGSVFNMKNNISVMDRSGGTAGIFHVAFYNSNITGTLNINNNIYYGTAGAAANGFSAGWVSNIYDNTQLAAYRVDAAPNETASNFTPVTFVSNTDLHLGGASNTDPLLDGVPAGGITTDIDAQTRSAATPTRGADEKLPTVVASTLTALNAYRNGAVNTVSWTTQQEINTQKFIVEHSADGRNFAPIGEVAAAGNSNLPRNYQFNDISPVKGINYYRLRTVDMDNDSKLSVIKTVKNAGEMEISIYPNPVQSEMSIDMYADNAGKGTLTVYDLNGAVVYTKTISISKGSNTFKADLSSLAKGSYTVRLVTNERSFVKKFVRL